MDAPAVTALKGQAKEQAPAQGAFEALQNRRPEVKKKDGEAPAKRADYVVEWAL